MRNCIYAIEIIIELSSVTHSTSKVLTHTNVPALPAHNTRSSSTF